MNSNSFVFASLAVVHPAIDLRHSTDCTGGNQAHTSRERTERSFFLPVEEIREKNYYLSISRYNEVVHEEIEYDPPQKIIAELEELEGEIQNRLAELKEMIG